ncbi:MAG: winged helix-turn-helix transcriptional regulator [Clostridia bacterium]|nr:winged helix-turn-helix transcriptional regulator [Clostridia bacterium]
MKNNKILFKIKTLEKMIIRTLFNDKCMFEQKTKSIPTPTQMQIIEYILEHRDEDVYQKDLEEVLKLRRATVSGVLQTMEKNNLIVRVINSDDSRTKKIILNENAKKTFLENEKKMENLEKIIISDISEEELDIFSNVIEKMKKNISKMNIN